MDLKTVKLNCLTLGEWPKKVEYPFNSNNGTDITVKPAKTMPVKTV